MTTTATLTRPKRGAEAETTYGLAAAVEWLQRETGTTISLRGFRSWVERGHIPFKRNLGPRGHLFWTEDMLREIAKNLVKERRFRQTKK